MWIRHWRKTVHSSMERKSCGWADGDDGGDVADRFLIQPLKSFRISERIIIPLVGYHSCRPKVWNAHHYGWGRGIAWYWKQISGDFVFPTLKWPSKPRPWPTSWAACMAAFVKLATWKRNFRQGFASNKSPYEKDMAPWWCCWRKKSTVNSEDIYVWGILQKGLDNLGEGLLSICLRRCSMGFTNLPGVVRLKGGTCAILISMQLFFAGIVVILLDVFRPRWQVGVEG